MDQSTTLPPPTEQAAPTPIRAGERSHIEPCDECLGTGGWYRYDPGNEPGVLYLSCLECRGTGRIRLRG